MELTCTSSSVRTGSRHSASTASPQAEEALRGPDRPAPAADVQHGAGVADDGEPAQHDGDGGRDEDRQQGDEEAVREAGCGQD